MVYRPGKSYSRYTLQMLRTSLIFNTDIVQRFSVAEEQPVRHLYFRLYSTDFSGLLSVKIYQCEDEEAPEPATESLKEPCTIDCVLETPIFVTT